ncbi:hypothetical protein FOZ62_012619, partial [Perkinsus olseni]
PVAAGLISGILRLGCPSRSAHDKAITQGGTELYLNLEQRGPSLVSWRAEKGVRAVGCRAEHSCAAMRDLVLSNPHGTAGCAADRRTAEFIPDSTGVHTVNLTAGGPRYGSEGDEKTRAPSFHSDAHQSCDTPSD